MPRGDAKFARISWTETNMGWFSFSRNCRKHVKTVDALEYCYERAVNSERFEYVKDKFTSELFHIGENDLFTTITTTWKPARWQQKTAQTISQSRSCHGVVMKNFIFPYTTLLTIHAYIYNLIRWLIVMELKVSLMFKNSPLLYEEWTNIKAYLSWERFNRGEPHESTRFRGGSKINSIALIHI